MANIVQEYEKFMKDEEQKIAEFKVLISKVIEEFLNATKQFCGREDLTELFNKWYYNLTDEHYIFLGDVKENGTLEISERVTDSSLRKEYTCVYNKKVFDEVNTFLEKAFPFLEFRLITRAYLILNGDGISIDLEFLDYIDYDSIVPRPYEEDESAQINALYDEMIKILRKTDAQVDILDDFIFARYHLG